MASACSSRALLCQTSGGIHNSVTVTGLEVPDEFCAFTRSEPRRITRGNLSGRNTQRQDRCDQTCNLKEPTTRHLHHHLKIMENLSWQETPQESERGFGERKGDRRAFVTGKQLHPGHAPIQGVGQHSAGGNARSTWHSARLPSTAPLVNKRACPLSPRLPSPQQLRQHVLDRKQIGRVRQQAGDEFDLAIGILDRKRLCSTDLE